MKQTINIFIIILVLILFFGKYLLILSLSLTWLYYSFLKLSSTSRLTLDSWFGTERCSAPRLVCTDPTPQPLAGYNTRSIYKQSTAGLNSEFSFSHPGCLTKAKEPRFSNHLTIAEGRTSEFMPFRFILFLCF